VTSPYFFAVSDLEPYDEQRGTRVRADGTIRKPFDRAELIAAVTKFLPPAGAAPVSEEPDISSQHETVEAHTTDVVPLPAVPLLVQDGGETIPSSSDEATGLVACDALDHLSLTVIPEAVSLAGSSSSASLTEPDAASPIGLQEEKPASFDELLVAELVPANEGAIVSDPSTDLAPELPVLEELGIVPATAPASPSELQTVSDAAQTDLCSEILSDADRAVEAPSIGPALEESSSAGADQTGPVEPEEASQSARTAEPLASEEAPTSAVAAEDDQTPEISPAPSAEETERFIGLPGEEVLAAPAESRQADFEALFEPAELPTAPVTESAASREPFFDDLLTDEVGSSMPPCASPPCTAPAWVTSGPGLFPASLSSAPQLLSAAPPLLDGELVGRIVHQVVSRMSPPILPPEVIEEISRKLTDELVAELTHE